MCKLYKEFQVYKNFSLVQKHVLEVKWPKSHHLIHEIYGLLSFKVLKNEVWKKTQNMIQLLLNKLLFEECIVHLCK